MSFLLYVFVASFTPGPNNIMAMLFAHQHGTKQTLRFCFGVGIGFFTLSLLCSYFNVLLKSFIPTVQLVMTILGASYMIYLAIKILRSNNQSQESENSKHNSVFSGALLQFVNPKGILYGITTTATFIIPFYHSHTSYFLFSAFLGLVGFVSTFCWSLFGSMFQKYLAAYRVQFNLVMAGLLVYCAVSILLH